MAFLIRVGNLLKRNARCEPSASSPFLHQAIRCMSSKLFVGGISYATDDMSLKEAFSCYGEIIEARVIMDRETGRSRGFGFVSFTSHDEASCAMQDMDGKDLHGRRIRVNYAVEKSRGGFPGFQGDTGFRDGASYGGGRYGGVGTPGGYNYASSQGGYDGGSGYRDNSGPANYVNRQGGGFDSSGARNLAASSGAGGSDFLSSADDDFTGKVHDDPANHLSVGIHDLDFRKDSSFTDQPGDAEVSGGCLKGEKELEDDLGNAKN